MRPVVRAMLVCLMVAPYACGGAPPRTDTTPAEDTLPPPPWHQPTLASAVVPPVYLSEWRDAENRATCALIAPESLGIERARARAATFGGGWAVAYDLPGFRSAFGVAGTGAAAEEPSYTEWPHERRWADGSSVGYGPEGGSGPRQLAYLRVAGQGCLYNVWSGMGVEHLEHLLEHLRFVEVEAI